MRSVTSIALLTILSGLASAQTTAKLKQELRAKEAAAKKSVDKLLEVAKWAEEKGLAEDAKRILLLVLTLDAENEPANRALGNVKVDGKWMTPQAAEQLHAKAREAEFKAKGLVEVDGVWVRKEQVDDAKRGVFVIDGRAWTKEAYAALTGGMVLHPVTGEIIDGKDLESASRRMFPIGTEGRWASEEDADKWHSDPDRPWQFQAEYCWMVGTLPIAKLAEIKQQADIAIDLVRPILGLVDPLPVHRPAVIVASTDSEYVRYGTRLGDEASAFSAFLATDAARIRLTFQGEVRPAVCVWHKDWGPYNVRHAAGLAYLEGICAEAKFDAPLWFRHAIAAYASRFGDPNIAAFFGEHHVRRGGVKDLRDWLAAFAINPTVEPEQLDYNVFQAGLLVSFAVAGGDAGTTSALQDVTAALVKRSAKPLASAIDKLKSTFASKTSEVAAYLGKVVKDRK